MRRIDGLEFVLAELPNEALSDTLFTFVNDVEGMFNDEPIAKVKMSSESFLMGVYAVKEAAIRLSNPKIAP